MKDATGVLTTIAFYATMIACWTNSVLSAAKSGEFGWLVASVLIWPLGVVRGLLLFLGVV